MKIGHKDFNFQENAYIMGILNVTPDSFSDGGQYLQLDDALRRVEELISEGADIIDIGGESTRPGHQQISVEEEINRVIPVIEKIKENFNIPLSIDAYISETVTAAIRSGIDLINDIWGLLYDNKVGYLAKEYDLPICLMHNRIKPVYEKDFFDSFLEDIKKRLLKAQEIGINEEKIILDPGIGFQKSQNKDMYVTKHLDALVNLGFPVLYASSRKRFIKNIVGDTLEQRDIGTTASTLYAYEKGARIFRVHNVKQNKLALKLWQEIERIKNAGDDFIY